MRGDEIGSDQTVAVEENAQRTGASANAAVANLTAAKTAVLVAYVFERYAKARPPGGDDMGRFQPRAVIGNNDLRSALEETVRGKTANGRRIQVRPVSALADSDHFQILLIERSESRKMREIAHSVAGKPVLTVCDFDSCLRDGGMIGFRVVDETVRFEVNLEAAERAGLKVSSQLLKVALPPSGKRR